MISKIELQLIIDDNKLDESGKDIMEKMLSVLTKLALYESTDSKRDSDIAIDLEKLILKCQELHDRYDSNLTYKDDDVCPSRYEP